jgi:hypothetical protein
MTRSLLIAVLLAAAPATAHAQSKVLVLIGHPVDNEFYFGHNADDPAILSQRVIPSKKGLRGVSFEESIIKPDSSISGAVRDWQSDSDFFGFEQYDLSPRGGGDLGKRRLRCGSIYFDRRGGRAGWR